jgi:epithelial splicing regulatory protein 1/2
MDPRNPEPQESQVALPPLIAQLPPQTALPYIPQSLITSGTKKDCIRLRNLPGGSQVTDILSFLGEFSQFIVYQGVHMVYSAQVIIVKITFFHVFCGIVAWYLYTCIYFENSMC